jgi:hypothetical protein
MESTPSAEATSVAGDQAATQQSQAPQGSSQAGDFIGYKPDQPDAGQNPQDQQGQTPNDQQQATPGKIDLAVSPDQVVGQDESGKAITAGMLRDGFLRQADYTRKTQELAEERSKVEPFAALIDENFHHLEAFASGDPDRISATLHELAEAYGVQLGRQPARGPDGRFASQQAQDGSTDGFVPLYDLEDFEPGTAEYEMADRANQAMEAQFRQMMNLAKQVSEISKGAEAKVSQSESHLQATKIATEWAKLGLDPNVETALSLVGQTIDVDAAMVLANWDSILRHNTKVAIERYTTQPNESSSNPPARVSLAGKSLKEAFDAVVGR